MSVSVAPATNSAAPRDHLTRYGVMLAVAALLIAGSVFPQLRISVGGLSIHPYLLPLGVFFVFGLMAGHLASVPRSLLVWLLAFSVLYVAATLVGPGLFNDGLNEIIKFATAVVTILTGAMLVRSRVDALWATVALAIAGAVIALRGLLNIGLGGGANALAGLANENATSLYTLPALLLAGLAVRDLRPGRLVGLLMLGAIVLICLMTFLSANRSGWLGVLIVGALLALTGKHRARAMLLIPLAGVVVVALFAQFDTRAFSDSIAYSTSERGVRGNDIRFELISSSLEIGVSSPLLGVSPQGLPYELGERLQLGGGVYSHNVFAHIVGGTGLLSTLALIGLTAWLWVRPQSCRVGPGAAWRRNIHTVLRIMLVLWFIRGFFTHEILYSPAFSLGLGVILGLCRVEGVWHEVHLVRRAGAGDSVTGQACV